MKQLPSAAAQLADLVRKIGPCHGCGADPAITPEIGQPHIEIDLEAGDYGEAGWVKSPKTEAWLECSGIVTDPQSPIVGQTCHMRLYLYLDELLPILEDLMREAMVKELQR